MPFTSEQTAELIERLSQGFDIHVEKANHTYHVKPSDLPLTSIVRVLTYGFIQVLSDAAAPVPTSAKIDNRRVPLQGSDLLKAQVSAKALVDRRLAGLVSGTSRTVRVGGSSDPVAVAAKRIAIGQVKRSHVYQSYMATNSLKLSDKAAMDKLNELANAQARLPAVIELAKAQVAMEAAIGDELSIGNGTLKPSNEAPAVQPKTAKAKTSKAA